MGRRLSAIRRRGLHKLRVMELRRWPRKNDPDSIRTRQQELRGLAHDGEVFWDDLQPFARATEALTGVAVVPVAVVGPLEVELGDYELGEPDGAPRERGRAREAVYVPLANTEGGLAISLYRGARAAAESGGFRTYVLEDRMTRASVFLFSDTGGAFAFARWIEGQAAEMRAWLEAAPVPGLSRHAKLREIETHVVGSMCHVMYSFTTGDAVGLNMVTRNSYALNERFVAERSPVRPTRSLLEANMGGDKKPSHRYFERGGHGKTVIAEATLTDEAIRRVLRTTADDLLELAFAGTHGAVASGMQSVAFTPASAIAAMFTATGQDIGMVGTSSMAHGTARRVGGGLQSAIRLPNLEVATVGGGTALPYARSWLTLMGCAGAGKVYRFAQVVAAATLALEISASAAMATAGSREFFRAHHERGGLR
jgi:hydroxymethylglutaryl-CoA reductase (NADPH)